MIQLVVNVELLRELDERKLINTYARLIYSTEEDVENDIKIKENLIKLFDWDINGDNGLGIYCGKFESIKRKDWIKLIQFIKDNKSEIEFISRPHNKKRKLEDIKVILDSIELKESNYKEKCINPEYKVSGRGRKAKPCIYEGKVYSSRHECMYKEGITQNQLYRYLEKTNQV